MLRNALIGIVLLVACSDDVLGPGLSPPPPGQDSLSLQLVAQGLSAPVFVTSPRTDSARLFVVEQGGRVRIIRNDTLTAEVFLDLRNRVSAGNEQGLLSIAFHPDYATNGYAFASYTNTQGDTRIVRFRVSADPESLDALSGDTILALDQPYANHNGGLITFGPDGYLYVGLGDGGSGGDPHNHGQDLTTLLGSLLRIDVDGALPYTVPATNPFVGHATARPEIWAYGLRNPWRFSFDRVAHDLYIADVGQGTREEVSVQPASSTGGENYGWRIMEGTTCFGSGFCSTAGLVLPVVDYENGDEGCAVTGGSVYRGSALPAFAGTYFYADYCAAWIRSFRYSNGQLRDHWDWSGKLAPLGSVSSFGEDARGELYVVAHNGRVWRLVRQT
jgi:glucose/arabinose dehydrogenase